MMTSLVASFLLLCLSLPLCAHVSIRTERLTTEQGLSQSIVYIIHQDRAGFLWFGTRDGIDRYDGYRFNILRHRPFDPTSLPWLGAAIMGEDGDGNIWIGSAHGAAMLDCRTFRCTAYAHDDADPRSLSNPSVRCIGSDGDGNIWIGTEHGLNRFDRRSGGFVRFAADPRDPTALANEHILSIYNDRSGRLWVGTEGGYLHRLNADGKSFTRFDCGLKDMDVLCFGEDAHGLIYVGSLQNAENSSIVALDRASGSIVRRITRPADRYRGHRCSLQPMCIDSLGGLWIKVQLWEEGRARVLLHRIGLDGGGDTTQSIGAVQTMICDRSGVLWGGTENGVVKLRLDDMRFATYRSIQGDPRSLSSDRIRTILRDRSGALWVGTDDGLNRLDERTGRWTRYRHDPLNPRSICHNTINTIFEDADGSLLFGTNDGVSRYDRASDAFSRVYDIPRLAPGYRQILVWSLYRDGDGRLWMGTRYRGLFLFDRDGAFLRRVPLFEGDTTRDENEVVWDIHPDSHGGFWVGTSIGLYRWSPGADGFRRYRMLAGARRGLSDDNVCAILEDPTGTLWFTTYGGGLNRYNRAADDFTAITTRDGLPGDALYGTLMDKGGRLWISSNSGLTAYDPLTGHCRTYNAGDGLQGNEFSFRAFYGAADGEFFFGGIHGLNRFRPASLRQSGRQIPVVITEFRVFDTVIRQTLSERDTVTITHDQSSISFEFAALDYGNPAGISYAYRLEGFDGDWTYCGQRRYASFTNLDPGTYVFMVKSTNSDGRWGTRPLRLMLRVIPPYWLTWWFRSLGGTAVLLMVMAGARLRVRSVQRRETLRRRSVESQLQALRLQINPHFIFNALGSIQHLILMQERNLAVEYLSRFSRLMRAVLENSERTSVPMAEEIENLRHYLYLEALRFDDRFEYVIEIDPALDIDRLMIPTMLIQPYVENAIRHGLLQKPGDGRLTISLVEKEGMIHCTIEDDGVGREHAGALRRNSGTRRRSMGMWVTEERLGILNAASPNGRSISVSVTDLADPHGAPLGTRVELFIPIEFAYAGAKDALGRNHDGGM